MDKKEKPENLHPRCPHCCALCGVLESQREVLFCPFCGKSLKRREESEGTIVVTQSASSTPISTDVTLVPGHIPCDEPVQFSIGPYQVLRSIGKGGMGEVFLAYDTICGRRIALKRIRADLIDHQQMHNRFLKEARVTSQLTHPAIIPIYAIHTQENALYYTMPYVEGQTLKQMLTTARQQEKQQKKLDHSTSTGSIAALVRAFLSVCQAVAYAHSKGVLHRDIKPENIIVGKYGEVMILDWGLAKLLEDSEDRGALSRESAAPEGQSLYGLTRLGKVVGTLPYLAPERALGKPASVSADIYSLGVILYQILTLRTPFRRKSLKEFRKNFSREILHHPTAVAPYRDVPRILAEVTMKCLASEPEQRYSSVDELLYALEGYIEGRSEWLLTAELSVDQKSDWEFQENVLIAEHVAITQSPEVAEWVSLMISKRSFGQNIKIETEVSIGEKGSGIGFLFSVPEIPERLHLNEGYTLWLSSEPKRPTKLLRCSVEVLHADIQLQRSNTYKVRIERIENHVYFYLNDSLQFSYLGLLPTVGTHLGILSKDADFAIAPLKISTGGQNITVNCLAVPDAFLAHKDFTIALAEYRRIGNAFPGTAEGREGMFRAGATLLEQARAATIDEERSAIYESAFKEFENLHGTSGAPLEYLGKALVYQTIGEYEEETKCFELALRRFPNHPLLSYLKEQILYRMHESARYDRRSTYNFVLLTLRHISEAISTPQVHKLFYNLQNHWEPLPFIESFPVEGSEKLKYCNFAMVLSFWLAKPFMLEELIDEQLKSAHPERCLIANSLYCLIELGTSELAAEKIKGELPISARDEQFLNIAITAQRQSLSDAIEMLSHLQEPTGNIVADRVALLLMSRALDSGDCASVAHIANLFLRAESSPLVTLLKNCNVIWSLLLQSDWSAAAALLHSYPVEILSRESTPLHFLYGCWLYATEGKEIASIHFCSPLEVPYPRSWNLFSHYFSDKSSDESSWHRKIFLWERRQLYRQQRLFYHCSGRRELEQQSIQSLENSFLGLFPA